VVVVFEVEPARQVALAKAISDFAREVLEPRDGFRSATVHRSLDGTRIVNVVECIDAPRSTPTPPSRAPKHRRERSSSSPNRP